MKLQGKKVVVLGGSSGIGLAAAHGAISDGAAVVVVSSSKAKVAAAVAALGSKAKGEVANLGEERQVAELFGRIGAFDHLAYTAGDTLKLGELASIDLATARQAYELRLFGAITAVKYAAPHIRAGGSIVLTTGIAGARPRKGWSLAASVCGAMEGLTRALAVELAPIRVNAVSPGSVRTPLWANIPEAQREAMFREVAARLPVGRVGEPEDLAEAYLYLMRNQFSTGQIVVADGGAVLV